MKIICLWMKNQTTKVCLILAFLLFLSAVAAVGIGPVAIPFPTVAQVVLARLTGLFDLGNIPEQTQSIIWLLRMPRVLLAILVGMALTMSGIAMQAFTKNPLASPYVLGISSGAGLGAVLAMATQALAFFGSYAVSVGAFLGSLLSILLVYHLSKTGDQITPIRLVLVGMAVSAMFTAISNYIVYQTPDDRQVRNVAFWTLGSLAGSEWKDLLPLVLVLPPGTGVLLAVSGGLNAMMMGEHSAITLGVDVNRIRKLTILTAALMTGTAVAVAGSIGFVGLVIPHVVRSFVGADHKKVIPISLFLSGIFMVWVDVAARMVDSPGELPIGIFTSMVGAPFFLWMIRKRRYSFGSGS